MGWKSFIFSRQQMADRICKTPDPVHIRNDSHFVPACKLLETQPDIPDPGSGAEVLQRSIYVEDKVEMPKGLDVTTYYRKDDLFIIFAGDFAAGLESCNVRGNAG